jgi:peroxiredoxin family protein
MSTPLRLPAAGPTAPIANVDRTDRVTFIVFSGEMDRLMAAFTMASGAAACGVDVTMFFTFWGAAVLRTGASGAPKSLVERCFGWLLPGGPRRARLSRLHMGGLGRWLMVREMRKKGIASLEDLMALARESGVRLAVCDTSVALLGISPAELSAGAALEVCGVAHMWDRAAGGQTVFI